MAKKNIDFGCELQELAKSFYREALKAHTSDLSQVKNSKAPGLGFRMVEGLIFLPTPELRKAEAELIRYCTKSLDPKFGHLEEISTIAWNGIANSLDNDKAYDDFIQYIKASFKSHTQQKYTVVSPNYLIRFEGDVRKIEIGPVTAVISEDYITSFPDHPKVEIHSSEKFKVEITSGKIRYELPPVIWSVTVNSAKGYSREEAAWNVDVAISLLRSCYEGDTRGLFPYCGMIEASPFLYSSGKQQEITLSDKISGGGFSLPRIYQVTDDILQSLESESFTIKVRAIFDGNRKNLSSRVGQGLGWLTRGRRSSDRAERFLFFFTAIESLLSRQDNSAPVTETIARRASAMLANKPTDRERWASKIKQLYSTRSKLVHRGDREVSQSNADEAQYLAESLYYVILHKEDLATQFSNFEKRLDSATYGTKWIGKKAMSAIYNETLKRYEEALEDFFVITRGSTQGNLAAARKKRKDAFKKAESELSEEEFCKWKKDMQVIRGRVFSNLAKGQYSLSGPLSNGLVLDYEMNAAMLTGNIVVMAGDFNPTDEKLSVAILTKISSPEKWSLSVNSPPFCNELGAPGILNRPLSEILDYLDNLKISKKS